jgi:purine-nucleoside phosphorylase
MSKNTKLTKESVPIAENGQEASVGEHPNAITNRFYTYERLQEIVAFLRNIVPTKPEIAIICGSGLGSLAELIINKIVIPYSDIPHFPRSTVVGHRSNLVFGILNGLYVVCMQGRFHPYEGYTTATCAFPVRVMHMLGAHTLIVTCAAGGVNKSYSVGDIMLIKDHINFPSMAGNNPLIGHNDERFGPRFPPVGHAYDRQYSSQMKQVANKHNIELREGIYCALGGPCYETIAEINLLRILGCDAVGMSIVHEVTLGAHCGFRILGLALITNKCLSEYDSTVEAVHEDVIRISELKANELQQLILDFLGVIKENQK